METDSIHTTTTTPTPPPPLVKIELETDATPAITCQNNGCEETEADSTVHAFNMSNITVIERQHNTTDDGDAKKMISCEGSDSGVEGLEPPDNCLLKRTLSTNSQDFQVQSCDSSIISCCSNYEEAYNILVRRSSTLFEDYKLRSGDGTSEGGSESSSVVGSTTSRNVGGGRKKGGVAENKGKSAGTARLRSKPLNDASKSSGTSRVQSTTDKARDKTPLRAAVTKTKSKVPDKLNLKIETRRTPLPRSNSATKTPSSTPTDDGRWPSVNSKPAPLMTRSLRGVLPHDGTPKTLRISALAETNKTLEKYATLPRRRPTGEGLKDLKIKSVSRENSVTRSSLLRSRIGRDSAVLKTLPPYPRRKQTPKTKIYHEISSQTALTCNDIERAFSGEAVSPSGPLDVEKLEKDVQVDMRLLDVERLQEELKQAKEKHDSLAKSLQEEKERNKQLEGELKEEKSEKESLQKELQQNSERVLALLGTNDENGSSDSLMVLETRFQNVSQVVIRQEEEIAKLNCLCRVLERDLEKSLAAQKALLQQHQELEAETGEMEEFMQAEKIALTDALKEAENEIASLKERLAQAEESLVEKEGEVGKLERICERKRQENFSLHARMLSLEAKSRELLVQQGSVASGAAVALAALISRLNGLVEELVSSYNISEQELEDVIFHNEVYSNSSPEATPEKCKKLVNETTPSKSGSSYVSAIINAIRNAVAQTPFSYGTDTSSKDNTMNSSSTEMLDFETEPCLMMEHVLEDAVIHDGFSQNMISSGHSLLNSRLSHSESLNSLPVALFGRQSDNSSRSLNTSYTSDMCSLSEICPPVSLVDQVIEVDNIITKLLKVIRIIQLENEDCMNELEGDRDCLKQQMDKQREADKAVVKQLKDWEILCAMLKTEVKDLLHQLSNKNNEIDGVKVELNQQRKEVEKLNQDVCELSTALSKTELLAKTKEEEALEAINQWEQTGEVPAKDLLGRLIVLNKEVPLLKEKLTEKEKRLSELTQEYSASRQVMSENLKEALSETKKLYEAIDNALDTLHNIQSVVQQCPPLAKLQRDLEETSFQTASSGPIVTPPDCNANAALLQALTNLEIAGPINSTA